MLGALFKRLVKRKGGLISQTPAPPTPSIHCVVQFKLVTSSCNLLISLVRRRSQHWIYSKGIRLAALQRC